MRGRSLRSRMTVAFTIAIALLMLITCAGLLLYARLRTQTGIADRLDAASRNFLVELGDRGPAALAPELREERAELSSSRIHVLLKDARGRVLMADPEWPK